MKSIIKRFEIQTRNETEFIDITQTVHQFVENSGITSGIAFILSLHTTTAITVNEGLPDLELDISDMLEKLIPDEGVYHHARFLPSDGQMAVNAPSHLRGALLGFQCFFPIEQGKLFTGSRQTMYFVELDGPQTRTWAIQLLGE